VVGPGTQHSALVTRFEPQYLGALSDFYRDIWDPGATPEGVARARARDAAQNAVRPGEEFPTYLFMQQDRILGHLTTIPVRLRVGGIDRAAHWLIGFMVRPEHRNGPIGFLLLKEAVRDLEVTLSLTVQPTTIRLLTAVGFRELGTLPNYLRPLRPGRMLSRLDPEALALTGLSPTLRKALGAARLPMVSSLAGLACRGGLGAWTAFNGRSGIGGQERDAGSVLGAKADSLWQDCRDRLGCVAGRDSAYLRWRYDASTTGPYRSIGVTHDGALRGLAVIRAPRGNGDPRLRGIRVATLSDLVYDPAHVDVGLALVAEAERVAHRLGADALMASTGHRAHGPLLRRRAFLRFGGNLHLLVRDGTGALPGPTTLADWWVLRGDMNADMVF
jgi:GNAT superfamily N-acetyltransferase